jgi:uncharacterized protein YndB with AHSA1/START domain
VEKRTKLTLPSDTEILITRDFKARQSNVFDAWCRPEWVAHWYGCAEQEMTTCELDFREGGAWRWGLRDEAGFEHVFSGVYRQIERPNRIVFTERYEAIPGSDHLVALGFEERSGVTMLTMRIIHETKEARDGHLSSGMEGGLEGSFDRLEAVAIRGDES